MKTSNKNAKGLTYDQHVPLAIDLRLAYRMLSDVYQDVLVCYPRKIIQFLPNPQPEIGKLCNLLDGQVFLEHPGEALSLKAKCIYYSGLGDKIYSYQKLSFRATTHSYKTKGKRKPFTKVEYVSTKQTLICLERFFTCLHQRLLKSYPGNSKLTSQAKTLVQKTQELGDRLEKELRKEHSDELFFTLLTNALQSSSVACIAPSQDIVKRYINAVKTNDTQLYFEVDNELKHSKCNPAPDSNQKAGLQ